MKSIKSLWKINYWIVFIAVCVMGSPITQEKVPPEVQKIIDETMSGQHGLYGFDSNKKLMGFDSSTKLSDLRAGKPWKVYIISNDSLKKKDETAPISEISTFFNTWEVPVLNKGKCVTTFEVDKSSRTQQWGAGTFYGCHYMVWEKVREAWPEPAGYHPVKIIAYGGEFFHVPEEDDYNLTPLWRHHLRDPLEKVADSSYKILMPSKIALKYLKALVPPPSDGGVK